MERALKSFLDGVSEDDNVVNLGHAVKNDNDEEKIEVIAHGNSSGMLDMREMAQRYQEMSSGGKAVEIAPRIATPEEPQTHTLGFVSTELEPEPRNMGWIFVAAASATLLVIVITAAVTASFVRTAVVEEIRAQQLSLVAPVPTLVKSEAVLVAAAPAEKATTSKVLEEEAPTMNFSDAEAVAPLRKTAPVQSKPAVPVSKPVSPIVPTEALNGEERTETVALVEVAMKAQQPAAVVEEVEVVGEADAVETQTPETSEDTIVAPAQDCDEVLCLVEGRGCCGNTTKLAPQSNEETIDSSLPERPSSADIKKGLRPINGRLNSCGTRHQVAGVVTLKIKIDVKGKVEAGSTNKGDASFKSCVAEILKKARFAKSQRGASLSYPIILR